MAWPHFLPRRPQPTPRSLRRRRDRRLLLETLERRQLLALDTLAGNGLLAQYYGDSSFSTLAFARIDSTVAANWLGGSPGASLGSDAFSVRWSGQIEAKYTEDYSFTATTDDAARLWVNGQLLVDGFATAGSASSPGTIALVAGRRYDIVLEYAEAEGNAAVSLRWSSASQPLEVIPATQLFAAQRGGLTRETWTGIPGGRVTDLTSAAAFPATPSTTGTIATSEAPANAGDAYGSRLRGFLAPPTTGTYLFSIAGDDAAELWLSNDASPEGRRRIAFLDSPGGPRGWQQSPTQRSVPLPLVAGQSYFIEALHKESGGDDSLAIGWMRPGATTFEPIAGEYLTPVLPLVSIYADTPTTAEGSASPARLSIVRSGGPTTAPLTVSYALQGQAANGVDYVALPGTITIPAGQSAVSLEVSALVDARAEGVEAVVVELKQAAGYDVDLRGKRTATISVQDDAPVPTGGTSILAGSARSNFVTYGGSFSTVTDATLGSVIQAAITAVPSASSMAQIRQSNAVAVTRGDVLWAEFWVRSDTSSGQFSVVFEDAVSYAKSLARNMMVDTNWNKVQIPFQVAASYAVGQANFSLQLGYAVQTLQFAGVRLLNFGPSPDLVTAAGLSLGNSGSTYGTLQSVSVVDQPFTTAFRLTTVTKPPASYQFQAVAASGAAVASGDTMEVTYWARSISGATPRISVVLQDRFGSYTARYSTSISPSSTWRQYSFTVAASREYAVGQLQVAFNAGFDPQAVEIGGFTWRDVSRVDVGNLPMRVPSTSYGGRSGTDAWRAAADSRIAANRMANLTVSVTDANGRAIPGAVVTLRQQRHDFRFGTAVSASGSLLSASGGPDALAYQALLTRLFNTAVVENSMKWVESDRNPQQGIDAAQWILDAGLDLRGHTAVWPSRSFMPAAVWSRYDSLLATDGKTAAGTYLRDAVAARIIAAADTFAGMAYEWDVVNEPYANHDVMDVLGDAVVADWYQLFREHDPEARLALNDYYIFARNGGDTAHRANFEAWLDRLTARSLVDVIGEQSHYTENVLTDITTLGTLIQYYHDRYSLPVAITEFDLDTTDEQLQADYLRDYMTMVFSQPGTDEFLQWGFWAGTNYQPDARLYRADFSIKPSGQAYEDLVFGDWWTDVRGTTFDGSYTARAFSGSYEVSVRFAGQTYTTATTVGDPSQTLAVRFADVVIPPPAAPVLALGAGVGIAPGGGATRSEARQPSGAVTVVGAPGAAITVTFAGVGGSVVRNLVGDGTEQAIACTVTELDSLGDGLVVVSATQSLLPDNPSPAATVSFTLDSVAPAAPAVVAGSGIGSLVNGSQAGQGGGVVLVTGEAAGTIAVQFVGPFGTVGKTLTASGAAQGVVLTPGEIAQLGDGRVTVTARQTDPAGNPGATSGQFQFTLDAAVPSAPLLTLNAGVANGVTAAEATQASGVVTVAGERLASIVVSFTRESNTVTKTLTGKGGPQAVVLAAGDLTTLGDGVVTVSAIQMDAARNQSQPTLTTFTLDTVVPATPSLTPGDGVGLAPAGGVTLAEATQASGVVTVAGESLASILVRFTRGSGSLTKTLTGTGAAQPVVLTGGEVAALGNGLVTVSATQTDPSGNQTTAASQMQFTLDTAPPSAPVVTLGTGIANGATASEATQASGVVTVKGESLAAITVTFVNGPRSVTKSLTGTGASQAVLLTPEHLTALGDGLVTVSAVLADRAGNPGPAGNQVQFVLDTTAPAAPNLMLGDGVANGASAAESKQPAGVVVVSGEPRAVIVVTFSRGTTTVTKTLTGTGAAQQVALSSKDAATLGNGVVTVSARQTDLVGYQSPSGPQLPFTLDTTAPATPTLTLGAGIASGATAAEATQASGAVTVKGESLASIAVTFTRATNTVTKTLVGTGSEQAVVLAVGDLASLGDGPVVVSAVQTDVAGNLSPSATAARFTLDTGVPTAPVLAIGSGIANGATAAEATQNTGVVTVTGESLATIVVRFTRGAASVTKTLTGKGTAQAVVLSTADLATLGDGLVAVSASQTDPSGNQSEAAAAVAFTLDRVLPVVTRLSSPTADGVYGIGATVVVEATLAEPVQAGGAIKAKLGTGGFVTLTALSEGTLLSGTYTVSPGEMSTDLDIVSYQLIPATPVVDVAGNKMTSQSLPPLSDRLATLSSIVISAGISASTTETGFSSDPTRVFDRNATVLSIPITFNTPVTGVTLMSFRLLLNGRAASLTGATLAGSGATWTLTLPAARTASTGIYSLQIQPNGIRAVANNAAMAMASTISWGNGQSVGVATTVARAFAGF
jgi:GH35 family endo-1,4-beta-xylanase